MEQQDEEKGEPKAKPGGCCCGDPFAGLPPELRPMAPARDDGLRHVTCPICGLAYRTNRKTDVCVTCEKAGRQAG